MTEIDVRSVVFVDIDGVLNTQKNYQAWSDAHREATGDDGPWVSTESDRFVLKLFDGESVAALNALVAATGAVVVVSSSWRHFYHRDPHVLVGLLRNAGVVGEIAGVTPTHVHDRGDAIEAWLVASEEAEWRVAILDDEGPATFRHLAPWHVKIDSARGFLGEDVGRALAVMETPWRRAT